MNLPLDGLTEFVATTQWDDIPVAVRQHAKLVFLDTLGVILAGSERPEVRQLQERLGKTAGRGATVYTRGWPQQDPRSAATINGIAGRSIELCEGMRLVSSQSAIQILPGALAVGEMMGSSGREMLAAFATGYEVAGRLCAAYTPRPMVHQNGQATLLAAVATGARLRGLDGAGIGLSMRIATTLLLTPALSNAIAGATTLNVAGGMCGFAAALAPELALAGFEAKADAIEESLGSLIGAAFKPDGMLDGLGRNWGITHNYFRLYACCNPIHPALDCLQAVLQSLQPHADGIERIDIATYHFASLMRNPEPPNYFASKYSLPHAAATMAVRGSAGFAALDDAALDDPAIKALRQRVHIVEESAMSALAPRLRPARVTLTLKDGRSATHELDGHRGDFHRPFAESELRGKFHELAGLVLTPQGVAQVEQSVDRAEDWSSVALLPALLRRHGKP